MAIIPSPWRRRAGRWAAGALLVSLAAGALAASAGAQGSREARKAREPYALIFGTVWNPDGIPVQGVQVRIQRADQRRPRWELVSDRRGEFAQRVPAGQAEYIIWAELPRPKRRDRDQAPPRPEVRVAVEYDERVDISLHLKQ